MSCMTMNVLSRFGSRFALCLLCSILLVPVAMPQSLDVASTQEDVCAINLPGISLQISRDGCLRSFRDVAAGFEHMDANNDSPLWQVQFAEEWGGTLAPSQAGAFDWSPDPNQPGGCLLRWSDFGAESQPELSVLVSVAPGDASAMTRWNISVEHLNAPPQRLHFPRLARLAPRERETAAVPYWMGEKTTRARQLLSDQTGAGHRREWTYPGIMSLQCITVYQEGGPGIYLAATDAQARSKSFALFGDGRQGLGIEACHFPGTQSLKDGTYAPGYAMVLGAYHGDWITAAEIYRGWGVRQQWAEHSRLKNGQAPAWTTDTAFWVWNRGYSEGVLEPAASMQAYLGLPVSVFWHWWHGCPYDVGFPEYLPPREGAESFRHALHVAQEQGIHAIVYMNQRLWGMTAASWAAENAERYAVKKPDGTVQPEVYNTFAKAPCASMCMGTSFWRNKYAGLAEEAFKQLGVNGIYMDQACSSLVCYDQNHEHAPGGGTYWMEGFRALEADIRDRCKNIALAGEGCGEAWLPHLDLMLSLQVSLERYADPGVWEPIPFFHAVYHGYAVFYGNYASLTHPPYDPLWPPEYAPDQPLQLLDPKYRYQFRLEQARSLVWGQQPCLANFMPEQLHERAEELDYLRRIVLLRQQALPFLLHGTFVRPPLLDIPEMDIDMSRLSIYAGQQGAVRDYRRTVPQYLAGAWRDAQGNLAVVVANISDNAHPLVFEVTRQQHGLPEQGRIVSLLPDARAEIGTFSAGRALVNEVLHPGEIRLILFSTQ